MDISTNLPDKIRVDNVNTLLDEKIKNTTDEKTAINFLATKTALAQQGTVDKIVSEKTEELKNDAEAKRVKAETDRINEEVQKVKAEKEKQIAELDKTITAKQKEVEELKAESDKAQAFFDANKEILKYIGVRSKKTMGVMKALMFPASIIFAIVQILLFPLTFIGVTLEAIVNVVGSICGAVKNNALKITIAVLVVTLIVGVLVCAYIFGGKLIAKI